MKMTRCAITACVAFLFVLGAGNLAAQSKGTIAPDEVKGTVVYIPYPVTITLDGKIDDWKGIPVERVENAITKSPDPKQNQIIDFAVAADDANFYIWMHSEDPNIIAGKHGENFWNEDSMEFYLNFTDNLTAAKYSPGIMQVTINATNIGKKVGAPLSISGTNAPSSNVKAAVYKTADGWAYEAAVPFPKGFKVQHGKTIGFQLHANGATKLDRDSKIIWGKLDNVDQSYSNPALFGRAVFFKTGSTDVPEPKNLGKTMEQTFKSEGATGKTGKKIIWADEFDYRGEPDQTKWAYDAPDAGKYNQELQTYTSARANSNVANGMLTISAIKDAAGKWSSARLYTKGKAEWTYGYFEIRAKLSAGKGTWPAIWMMPAQDTYGEWPASGEIDIMEFVGFEKDLVHASLHTKKYNHRLGTQPTRAGSVPGVCSDFHTYAVEWSPKGVFWYVDDVPFYFVLNDGTGHDAWPFDKPFFVILNMAMGGSWGGMNGMDESLKQADMTIDYVRVYR